MSIPIETDSRIWYDLLSSQQPFVFSVQPPVTTFTTTQETTTDTTVGVNQRSSVNSSNSVLFIPPEEKESELTATTSFQLLNQSPTQSKPRSGNGSTTFLPGAVGTTNATNCTATTQSTTAVLVSKAACWGTSHEHSTVHPVYIDGNPVHIDGNPVLFFDKYVDQYLNPNRFQVVQGVCYLCQEPCCLENQDLISTGCPCKAILHQECYSELLEYGNNFKMNPENANRNHMHQGTFERHHLDRMQLGGELPRITRMCGNCNRACLGNFNDQFDFTSLALRRFNRLRLEDRKKQWPTVLPPIIFSLEQIIKSIRHDWRSNGSINIVLSGLVASLSLCYTVVGRFAARTEECNLAASRGLMTTIIAMATCGNFTNMGVSSMPFIMDVLFKPFGGKTTAGRSCVPVVFEYLLNLLRNTTDGEVVGKRTGDYNRNPARCDDIAHKHRRSQHYLLAILNSNMQKVDETLHKWCLDTLFSFM